MADFEIGTLRFTPDYYIALQHDCRQELPTIQLNFRASKLRKLSFRKIRLAEKNRTKLFREKDAPELTPVLKTFKVASWPLLALIEEQLWDKLKRLKNQPLALLNNAEENKSIFHTAALSLFSLSLSLLSLYLCLFFQI